MYNSPLGYGMGMAAPTAARSGLGGMFGNLLGRGAGGAVSANAIRQGINWGGILTNTQKTLGIINQAIPIVYQVKPIMNNAKTMFKIADAVRDTPSTNTNNNDNNNTNNTEKVSNNVENSNRPIFYL